ncbi:MAG: DUF4062 domain-containing protein [Burkholderiaceae bacterium]
MARVFISSTFQDLKYHREAVYVALRRLGHESVAVEEWAATDQPLVERSLANLRTSDVAVFLVAWRYGHIPAGEQHSVTELEYRAARDLGIPCLVFLTSDDAPWPPRYFDDDAANITRFRNHLLTEHLVAFFDSPDALALQVAASLHAWVASGARELSPTPQDAVSDAEAPGPEVFLSYAHEDVGIAESISERIGREKWSVFWDRTIPVGFTWDQIVEEALDAAKCVVVLWSPASRNSEWVRIEATEGAERQILAPALIAETKIPLRFRQIQAADLVGWNPEAQDSPGMHALLTAIRRCLKSRDQGTA